MYHYLSGSKFPIEIGDTDKFRLMVIYLRLATSEVSDHRGEDEGEGGEGEGDELPAAVEPAVLPDLELLPAKKNRKHRIWDTLIMSGFSIVSLEH